MHFLPKSCQPLMYQRIQQLLYFQKTHWIQKNLLLLYYLKILMIQKNLLFQKTHWIQKNLLLRSVQRNH